MKNKSSNETALQLFQSQLHLIFQLIFDASTRSELTKFLYTFIFLWHVIQNLNRKLVLKMQYGIDKKNKR